MSSEWFQTANWGVFMHYLAELPGSQHTSTLSSEEWNRQIDGFDVAGLTRQLQSIGAGYLVITLGQNSGHYLSPNATYDELTGISPSKCSRRDLVMELSDSLSASGIPLMVYLPSGAPEWDSEAAAKLQWKKDGGRLAGFQRNWERVIQEWSLRWGRKIKGWWIDGCYYADDMYRHPEPPNFQSFADAMKAGNPDALVTFNPGVRVPVISHSACEDYTAGEISIGLPVFSGDLPHPPAGEQFHLLSFLGSDWSQGKPRFPDDLVIAYTRYINLHGGVISWDVPHDIQGHILPEFINQLTELKHHLA